MRQMGAVACGPLGISLDVDAAPYQLGSDPGAVESARRELLANPGSYLGPPDEIPPALKGLSPRAIDTWKKRRGQ